MYCLYCGDCCKRMSPISQPEPCPYLVEQGGFYFCFTYEHRPKECQNHEYPTRFCPIGLGVLKLGTDNPDAIRRRIDKGWSMIKEGLIIEENIDDRTNWQRAENKRR